MELKHDPDSMGIIPYLYGAAAFVALWCLVGAVCLLGSWLSNPEESNRWKYPNS
jgi:hypothetical protein